MQLKLSNKEIQIAIREYILKETGRTVDLESTMQFVVTRGNSCRVESLSVQVELEDVESILPK